MSIGIYKITNPSGRIYVGQSIHISKREEEYKNLRNCKKQPKIYYSLAKYGWDSHKFETLEECSLELLNERETFWKVYYLNLFENNWGKVLFCGLYDNGGGPMRQETKDKISQSKSGIPVHSQEFKDKMRNVHLGIKRSKETCYKISQRDCYKNVERSKKIKNNRDHSIIADKLSMKVYQINPENLEIIKIWKSISELYRNGFKGIDGAFRNQKLYKGSIWLRETDYSYDYVKENLNIFLRKRKLRQSPITQYDLEGNLIREWPSIAEASRNIRGDISGSLRGRYPTAGGFIWKHKK